MALIGECRGWHMETELLSCWKEYRAMFHHIPSQSRFNRRRRNLMQAFNLIRGQLSDQFAIEKNYAHTFWGLCTRLISKLTAHTLCMSINRLLGKPDFLQIKALAFPN